MHELSVCYALIGEVERISRERGARSVTRIEVEIGPLSGVEPGLLRNAYPLAAAGTLAEHAELVVTAGDVVVECSSCGGRSTVAPNRLLCTHCSDYRTRVVAGDEMLLRRIELETALAS